MVWQVPRIWEGGDVWILGGGPSVPTQFDIPSELVQNVIKGTMTPKEYSPYMEKLHNKHVIGINCSYLIGDWMDIIFFGDHGFFLAHQKGLSEYPGIKASQ